MRARVIFLVQLSQHGECSASPVSFRPTLRAEHIDLAYEVRDCHESLTSQPIPAACREFFCPKSSSQPVLDTGSVMKFCRRRIYSEYLSMIPGMFEKRLSLTDTGECEQFLDSYDAIPYTFSMSRAFSEKWTIRLRAHAAMAMLTLLQRLHQSGFSHGRISQLSFGVTMGFVVNPDRLVNSEFLHLTELFMARSMFTIEGKLDAEVLIAAKQDLFDFSSKIMSEFFPHSSLSEYFLMDVETTRMNLLNFDYAKWYEIFTSIYTLGVVVKLPSVTEVIPVIYGNLLDGDSWLEAAEECEARISGNYVAQCINPGMSQIKAKGLGHLVPTIDAVTLSVSEIYKQRKLVRLGHFSKNVVEHCHTESLLSLLNGLGGYAQMVYPLVSPQRVGGCSTVVDVISSASQDGAPLVEGLGNALAALQELHSLGLVHNGLSSNESFRILPDGNFKFMSFERVEFFADRETGKHLAREQSGSRKSDVRSLVLIVARALEFNNDLVNELLYEVDGLRWNDSPDYDMWINRLSTQIGSESDTA